MTVRQYRWHHCSRSHVTGRSFAECAFPIEYSVRGSGQWAVVSDCLWRAVTLYASQGAAVQHLEQIDVDGCGAGCEMHHELAYLDVLHSRSDYRGHARGHVA